MRTLETWQFILPCLEKGPSRASEHEYTAAWKLGNQGSRASVSWLSDAHHFLFIWVLHPSWDLNTSFLHVSLKQSEDTPQLIGISHLLPSYIFHCKWIIWDLGSYLSVLWVWLYSPFHTEWNINVVQGKDPDLGQGSPAGTMTLRRQPAWAALQLPSKQPLSQLHHSTSNKLLRGW